jgi:hypothetical protein
MRAAVTQASAVAGRGPSAAPAFSRIVIFCQIYLDKPLVSDSISFTACSTIVSSKSWT